MMEHLQYRIYDIVDFAIVWLLIYRLLLVVKGTRASQMFLGLGIIYLFSALADTFQLTGLNRIFSSLKTVWLVAFVILFQPELRRALAQTGQFRIFRYFFRLETTEYLQEIVKAAKVMALKRIGGLIVIERDASLRSITETGHRIDAKVSAELIVTIFTNYSPLHDGAIIVRDETLIAAGCILPLSQVRGPDIQYGTRHRAAIGMTEETDAVVVVVSEETGTLSVAFRGTLGIARDENDLMESLSKIMRTHIAEDEPLTEGSSTPAGETKPPAGSILQDTRG